jgi:hypothetical protein
VSSVKGPQDCGAVRKAGVAVEILAEKLVFQCAAFTIVDGDWRLADGG